MTPSPPWALLLLLLLLPLPLRSPEGGGDKTPDFGPGATSGEAVGGGRGLREEAEGDMPTFTAPSVLGVFRTECLWACGTPLMPPVPSALTEGRGEDVVAGGRARGAEGDDEVEM